MRVDADVLVIGGGPAGVAAAAAAAARAGGAVVLADKGGIAAPESPGRFEPRERGGGRLSERRWVERVRAEVAAADGPSRLPAGVRVLEGSPVLELLTDAEGSVAGARGLLAERGFRSYEVRAGAVVLATGACDYGAGPATGDGALMAVEVGADLSGMEFSEVRRVTPDSSELAFSSWARFYRADGSLIEAAGGPRSRAVVARILQSEPVYARLDRAGAEPVRDRLRLTQARFFLPYDLQGIDPFTELFPVTMSLDAVVGGAGGIRVRGDDCCTGVSGLYVAGDAAGRELVSGGFAAEPRADASWALASGKWAGRAAARFAAGPGATTAGRRAKPAGGTIAAGHRELVAAVRAEMLAYDRNHLRHANRLGPALAELDALWNGIRSSPADSGEDALRAREAAAMTAFARWTTAAALARTESRGLHRRSDYPSPDPAQHHRLVTGGLDAVWTKAEPLSGRTRRTRGRTSCPAGRRRPSAATAAAGSTGAP